MNSAKNGAAASMNRIAESTSKHHGEAGAFYICQFCDLVGLPYFEMEQTESRSSAPAADILPPGGKIKAILEDGSGTSQFTRSHPVYNRFKSRNRLSDRAPSRQGWREHRHCCQDSETASSVAGHDLQRS
jgi:hypothetical protein